MCIASKIISVLPDQANLLVRQDINFYLGKSAYCVKWAHFLSISRVVLEKVCFLRGYPVFNSNHCYISNNNGSVPLQLNHTLSIWLEMELTSNILYFVLTKKINSFINKSLGILFLKDFLFCLAFGIF